MTEWLTIPKWPCWRTKSFNCKKRKSNFELIWNRNAINSYVLIYHLKSKANEVKSSSFFIIYNSQEGAAPIELKRMQRTWEKLHQAAEIQTRPNLIPILFIFIWNCFLILLSTIKSRNNSTYELITNIVLAFSIIKLSITSE